MSVQASYHLGDLMVCVCVCTCACVHLCVCASVCARVHVCAVRVCPQQITKPNYGVSVFIRDSPSSVALFRSKA